jgi:hypothetical protein
MTVSTRTILRRGAGLGATALALTLVASSIQAQEAPPPRGATAAESHEEHGEEHANELGVFLGGTSENDETHFTIGVEYERRLSGRLGLGFVAEHVDGVDAWVFLAPLSFQPGRHLGLTLYAGPGFESKVPEPESEEAALEERDREAFFVFRVGTSWALELGPVGLHPQVEVDFVREHDAWQTALVFGVALGFGF